MLTRLISVLSILTLAAVCGLSGNTPQAVAGGGGSGTTFVGTVQIRDLVMPYSYWEEADDHVVLNISWGVGQRTEISVDAYTDLNGEYSVTVPDLPALAEDCLVTVAEVYDPQGNLYTQDDSVGAWYSFNGFDAGTFVLSLSTNYLP